MVCFGVLSVFSLRRKSGCFLGFCGLGWLVFFFSLPLFLAFWHGLYTSLCMWLHHFHFLIYSIFYLSKNEKKEEKRDLYEDKSCEDHKVSYHSPGARLLHGS